MGHIPSSPPKNWLERTTLFSQYFPSCQTSSVWDLPFHVTKFSLVNESERISTRGLTCMLWGIRGRSTSLLKLKCISRNLSIEKPVPCSCIHPSKHLLLQSFIPESIKRVCSLLLTKSWLMNHPIKPHNTDGSLMSMRNCLIHSYSDLFTLDMDWQTWRGRRKSLWRSSSIFSSSW